MSIRAAALLVAGQCPCMLGAVGSLAGRLVRLALRVQLEGSRRGGAMWNVNLLGWCRSWRRCRAGGRVCESRVGAAHAHDGVLLVG